MEPQEQKMDNAVVLVTGACGDISRTIALAFAQTGARLVLNDLVAEQTAEHLMDAIRAAGGEAAHRYQSDRLLLRRTGGCPADGPGWQTRADSLNSSWVQDVPSANISAYCVATSGLKMLARTMALELGRHQIAVNVIAPGFVDAGLSGRVFREDPGLRARSEKLVPLGYIASAGDVAASVMLLCSPAADYVTGTTLLVDGGNSLFYAFHRFEREH
jgi:NAD(P)-dependent dehydrogenase (short-subunit alcohol dehydrogenase family)